MARANRPWFKFRASWAETILDLEDDAAGRISKAICETCLAHGDAWPDEPETLPDVKFSGVLGALWRGMLSEINAGFAAERAGKRGGDAARMVGRGVGTPLGSRNQNQKPEPDKKQDKEPDKEQDKDVGSVLSDQDRSFILSQSYSDSEINEALTVVDWSRMRGGSPAWYLIGIIEHLRQKRIGKPVVAQDYQQRNYDEVQEALIRKQEADMMRFLQSEREQD